MRVPKYIKNKLKSIVYHQNKANEIMQEVEEWLERNGFDIEELRSGDGESLEEFEYGNDVTEYFCEKLEEMQPKRGVQ